MKTPLFRLVGVPAQIWAIGNCAVWTNLRYLAPNSKGWASL